MLKTILSISILCLSSLSICAQSNFTSNLKIGNKKGATVKGIVECDGKPVRDVVVSDGYEVTRTDAKGAYYLPSVKKAGLVFISIPSGYETVTKNAVPAFWSYLNEAPDKLERHDFHLKQVDNNTHALLAIADIHLINARNDMEDFTTAYVDRLREETEKYTSRGIPVYTIDLGDATWDRFWYENGYRLPDFRQTIESVNFPTPFFKTMGNHDHDPATEPGEDTDFRAAKAYRESFGPNYYSFNLGKIHYVVLDNIVYKNEKDGKKKDIMTQQGLAGTCSYDTYIPTEQMEWLRKDLKEVADPANTPVYIAFHAPMFKATEGTDVIFTKANQRNEKELYELTAPFKEVHLLTGHTHKNATMPSPNTKQKFIDHTVAGTSGNWWWTRAYGDHNLCGDGIPVGFATFLNHGNDVSWNFKAFEYPEEKQMFAFDMNKAKEYFTTNGSAKAFLRHYPKWTDYNNLPENTVYISIWNWDPEGTVEVSENEKNLKVEKIYDTNPLYMATYMTKKTVWNDNYPKGYAQPRTTRMFKVVASGNATPLEITYTDRFGNKHTEKFNRPAVFDRSIF